MKVQGRERAEHPMTEEMEENEKLLKTDWWKDIPIDKLPYAPRPKGGKRIDFYAYANLQDVALEIKESSYHFKHTGDVHRNAHYIGMYLLREKHVKNKNPQDLDAFMLAVRDELKRGRDRSRMLEEFRGHYDNFINSLSTKEEFQLTIKKMKDAIQQEDTKKWFIDSTNAILGDEEELRKSKNRSQMQRVRAELAGIKIVNE